MDLRKNVVVAGIRGTWTSNLDDDGLREFYQLHREEIDRNSPTPTPPGAIQISFRYAFLPFRDGLCLWTRVANSHNVIYRSNRDWELWQSRNAEIEELREEQQAEEFATRQLMIVEDNHLQERTELALKTADFDTAAALVFARAELRLMCDDVWRMPITWPQWRSHLIDIFNRFPRADHGMTFLRKYDMRRQAWTNFAHWYASRREAEDLEFEAETGHIYDEAFLLFPSDGYLYQAACLFWRRQRRYARAVQICKDAIAKGLRDGTKSGFAGRLKRLEKEAARFNQKLD